MPIRYDDLIRDPICNLRIHQTNENYLCARSSSSLKPTYEIKRITLSRQFGKFAETKAKAFITKTPLVILRFKNSINKLNLLWLKERTTRSPKRKIRSCLKGCVSELPQVPTFKWSFGTSTKIGYLIVPAAISLSKLSAAA